jgi:hypothetical protein
LLGGSTRVGLVGYFSGYRITRFVKGALDEIGRRAVIEVLGACQGPLKKGNYSGAGLGRTRVLPQLLLGGCCR